MKDRISQFLKYEHITPAEFADKIGVQRSSVSHVLNGRNHPSASFIQKMLQSFKSLNPRWLLLGEGAITDSKPSHGIKETTLFPPLNESEATKPVSENVGILKENPSQSPENLKDIHSVVTNLKQPAELNLMQSILGLEKVPVDNKEVERIVLFYQDKTFAAYTPSK